MMTLLFGAVLFVRAGLLEYHAEFPADVRPLPIAEREARGWYNLVCNPPQCDAKHYPRAVGYERIIGGYARVYEIAEIPRRIRHFSKLKLYVVMSKLGITDEQFMAWLATKEVEVEGVTLRGDLAFNKAQDLTDDHPMFENIVKDAQEQFGITDAQLAEILNAIEYDPNE